jgi:predicted ATPase
MALHAGEADLRDGDYYGNVPNRCARLRALACGGQVLMSAVAAGLIGDGLPEGVIVRDLGVHRLKDLTIPEHIFQVVSDEVPADFLPLRSVDALPTNLPVQVTSFVGREPELAEVKRLLRATRLLTLMGAGGCGKTRLALQAAADLLEDYPAGVWVVDLAALSEPELVPYRVAAAVGVREEHGSSVVQTLVRALRSRQLLLVLDNCEHLVAACAALVDGLLHSCPHLHVQTTSREALAIAGETTWRVPPLRAADPDHLPDLENLTQYEAVRLFIERAVSAQPAFAVTNQNAPAVAQICHRLDGIPLAIELAAARVKILSADQIAGRLDDRFHLLTAVNRTALPRQQTLKALVDWSHDLLTVGEKVLFRRLSVFTGGWTLEASEAVCADEPIRNADVLDLLSGLVDKSLVLADEQSNGTMRYRLLETLREYATVQLRSAGEYEHFQSSHARYFVEQAERLDEHRLAADWGTWGKLGVPWFAAEMDNLRAVLARSRDHVVDDRGDRQIGLRLCNCLWWLWIAFGQNQEAWDWHRALLRDTPYTLNAVRAWATWGAGIMGHLIADFEHSTPLVREAYAMAQQLGDPPLAAAAIGAVGEDLMHQGRLEEAKPLLEQSLAEVLAVGPRCYVPIVYYNPARLAFIEGRLDDAAVLLDQAIDAARGIGFLVGLSLLLPMRGMLYISQGQLERAETVLREGEAVDAPMGRQFSFTGLPLGQLALVRGDLDTAASEFCRVLNGVAASGSRIGTCQALTGLAFVLAARGQANDAAQLFGASDRVREEIKTPFQPDDRERVSVALDQLRAGLGDGEFQAAWEQGREQSVEEAIALGRRFANSSSSGA